MKKARNPQNNAVGVSIVRRRFRRRGPCKMGNIVRCGGFATGGPMSHKVSIYRRQRGEFRVKKVILQNKIW